MSSLVTPSAKSYERVTGRWLREIRAETKQEWSIFYIKQAVGTPVPWVFLAFVISLFVSRSAAELCAWIMAFLTCGYIIADRFVRDREFRPFLLGSDLLILGFVLSATIGLFQATSLADFSRGIGNLRWAILIYAVAYTWQLFPGLNRYYLSLFFTGLAVGAFGVWQHFGGFDPIRGKELQFAPLKEHAYLIVSGLFRYPETFGGIFSILVPLPAAAYMLCERRDPWIKRLIPLAATATLLTLVLWTYRPGLWYAAAGGLFVVMVLQPRRHFRLLAWLIAVMAAVILLTYGHANSLFSQVGQAEASRAQEHRQLINEQLRLWGEGPWFGVGLHRQSAVLSVNQYFQFLAQTGVIGLGFYLIFSLSFLLGAYRVWRDLPVTHYWHRVLVSGAIGGIAAFHVAGLSWATFADSQLLYVYVLLLGTLGYLRWHYDRGLVPDDQSL